MSAHTDGWRTRPLGDLTDNFDTIRVPVKEAERKPGPYPYYGASGIIDHVDGYLFDGDYLLIAEDGENLRTRTTPIAFMASGKFWVNNHAHIVRANRENDTRFLMYALSQTDISGHLTGSTMPKLTQANMNRIPVLTPHLRTQRAIVRVLGSLDDKIDLNRRMNETLEAMARAVFRSWFVDFEPVRAKAEGRAPAGMDAATAALFPDHFTDSPLGPTPAGWTAGRWGDHITLEYGKSLRDYESPDAPYPVYGTNGPIGRHTQPLCDHPGIVIGRKGAYRGVHYSPDPFFVIDTAFYVEPKADVELRWAYYSMLDLDINGMDSGSAIPSTSRDDFYALPVIAPPVSVQKRFVALLNPMWKRQDENNKQSRTLAAIRDALLPRLLSGELRLPEAEAIAEAAT